MNAPASPAYVLEIRSERPPVPRGPWQRAGAAVDTVDATAAARASALFPSPLDHRRNKP